MIIDIEHTMHNPNQLTDLTDTFPEINLNGVNWFNLNPEINSIIQTAEEEM